MPSFIDLTGKRFGFLTVLHRHGLRSGKDIVWKCQCDCGNFVLATGPDMKRTRGTKSCGCHRAQQTAARNRSLATHEMTNTPTYKSWMSMKQRCYNPNSSGYEYYGAKGVIVCDRWLTFENFLSDMGRRPPGTTIDRYPDIDGDYESNNCRWGTVLQQRHNQHRSLHLTYRGQKLHAKTWETITGISYHVLVYRIQAGWDTEQILETPVRHYTK